MTTDPTAQSTMPSPFELDSDDWIEPTSRIRRSVTAPMVTLGPPLSEAERWRSALDHPAMVFEADAERRLGARPWATFLDGAGAESSALDWHLLALIQLCHLVEHAHSRGVVHRDLRPGHVLVGSMGEVYVHGWDAAAAAGEVIDEVFEAEVPLDFAAPERFEDTARPTQPTCDIFGLGACLHWVLTGRGPSAAPDRERQRRQAQRAGDLRYPPRAPSGLVAICRRALTAQPADRFPSVGAMRRAIEVYMTRRRALDDLSAAQRALDELRRGLEGGRLDEPGFAEAFGRCRALFDRARTDWPDEPAVRDGLQSLLELGIMRAINDGQHPRAERLIETLPRPRPDLTAALERARTGQARKSWRPFGRLFTLVSVLMR